MLRRHKLTAFNKMVILFIAAIFPFITVGTIALNISSQRISHMLEQNVQNQIQHSLDKLDGDMERIQYLTLQLLQNNDANQLAKLPDTYDPYEKSVTILRLQQTLTSIKNSSPLISNVRILFPSLGWAINADGYQYGSYTPITQEEISLYASLHSADQSDLVLHDGHLLMPIDSYDSVSNVLFFVIEVEFSQAELQKELSEAVESPESRIAFEIPTIKYSAGTITDTALLARIRNMQDHSVIKRTVAGTENLIFCESSSFLNARLYVSMPSNTILLHMQILMFMTCAFFILVAVSILIYLRFTDYIVKRPLMELVNAFQEIKKGHINVRLIPRRDSDFAYLYREFNEMSSKLNTFIDQVYRQRLLIQKAELKQFQAQINPHFLYNSYFMLHRLVKEADIQRAASFSKMLGIYFRYITRNNSDTVPLKEEDEHARIYAKIQAARFEGRIAVSYQALPDACREIEVPRLIMQPILENAFTHGLRNKQADGILSVHFELQPQSFTMVIEDNGDELTDFDLRGIRNKLSWPTEDRADYEITGLDNINRRLQIFFGGKSGLYAERSDLGGLRIRLRIDRGDT